MSTIEPGGGWCLFSPGLHPTEVKAINKQKFLAELGRLLTFMYEEDRQTALAMYSKMFDDAAEEQLLLQFLVSPTRQAVVLARAYDAKERKLQVHTQSRAEDGYADVLEGELPPFILSISDLQQEAAAQGIFELAEEQPPVDEDQFSLFDEISQLAPTEQEQEEVWSAPAVSQSDAPAETAALAEEDAPVNDSVSEFADAVDAFLADFAIADGELVPKKDERPDEAEEELPEAMADTEEQPEAPAPAEIVLPIPEDFAPVIEPESEEEQLPATQRKAQVFLLILYILVSIPLGIIGIAALLVPTLLSLSLAIGFVSAGVLVLTAAFGGFSIFADLMVILGLAIMLLALGLLLTWLFIWFIGGAIVGLIRGLCHLGGKWCYKEVPVQ